MTDAAPRVAVLARPGDACERIRQALDAIGADSVLVGDPTAIAPEALAGSGARAVVIVLDPAVENALDRFDKVLGAPGLLVLYEEAELALRREGWEVARWQRHLAAKLYGHGDVLPPVPEDTGGRETEDERALEAAFDAAAGFEPADEPVEAEPHEAPVAEAADGAIEFESALEAEAGSVRIDIAPSFDPVAAEYAEAGDFDVALDVVLPEIDSAAGEYAIELDAPALRLDDAGDAPAGFEFGSIELDTTAADVTLTTDTVLAPLALEGDAALEGEDAGGRQNRLNVELAELERRIASLSLVDERVPAEDDGAVVVFAGIGGPDAVRQLLGALPAGFPRPVLVRQRLDGGRYDKLVTQMQRVSAMPVRLAESGMRVEPGIVYILPPELGLQKDAETRFSDTGADPLAVLPAADSAVLLLSGTDPATVDSALAAKAAGALVAGQALDGCFDTAAVDALIARGGDTGAPVELAARLVERWRQRATFGEAT